MDGAELEPEGTTSAAAPFGAYVAGGVTIQDAHQVLARFDQFDPAIPAQAPPDDQVAIGYNYEPSSLLRILLNDQTPVSELSDGLVTARLQVAIR